MWSVSGPVLALSRTLVASVAQDNQTHKKGSHMRRDTEALIQDLMATPVGRRWLLKAGLGSAAAIAAAALPLEPLQPCHSSQADHVQRVRRGQATQRG